MPVRVVLAGHNLDRDLLLELRGALEECAEAATEEARTVARERARRILAADNWTPETLSAAYARVSRDPQSVTELRAIARAEVGKARRSNENIIFGLGHSSVAEHAVFNLDLLGLSRLGVELLERQRLASYTEKSQRYILLEEDWVLPEEIRGTPAEAPFGETVAAQHRFYREAYERLLPHVLASFPELAEDKKHRRTLEGLAKEDARYSLGLCTTVQLGETVNARNLEALIARCRAHPLHELRELGEALYSAVAGLAPSLIKYVEPTSYRREARAELRRAVEDLPDVEAGTGTEGFGPGTAVSGGSTGAAGVEAASSIAARSGAEAYVRLVSCTPDPDGALVSALLFAGGHGSMDRCRRTAAAMDEDARRAVVLSHQRNLGPHDSILREYEMVDVVFELVVSASCFAQLKRHRMATLVPLAYDPALGVTIPDSFAATGLVDPFRELVARTEECYQQIRRVLPARMDPGTSGSGAAASGGMSSGDASSEAAAYVLTNAHRRRVLFKANARELHHLSRLREDAHAQWDIRRVSARMLALAREKMPLSLLLAAGKDRFEERKSDVLGIRPHT